MTTYPIPRDTSIALGNALRFQILGELNKAFVHSDLTVETVASRLGWAPRRVRRALSGKTELTLRMIAELAWAVDGGLIEFNMVPRSA